nr:DeoR/GlpR family DNA-binding transcription regulator [Actibacterium sp. MT2.3-13A]
MTRSKGSKPNRRDAAEVTRPTPARAPRVERIPAQRHAAILEHLRETGAASVQELAEVLGASASTVRRDLDYLMEREYLERTHGGAAIKRGGSAGVEVESEISSHIQQHEKALIGAAAAMRVQPHQTVIFDSGTTVLQAARAVTQRGLPLTAITNDLGIAQILGGCAAIRVHVPGGTLRNGSPTLLGSQGETFFKGVHADLAFVGAHAVTGDLLTDSSLELADMKRAMIGAGQQVILLADSSKFGPPSIFDICTLARIAEVISDDGMTPDIRKDLRARGVALTLTSDGAAQSPEIHA